MMKKLSLMSLKEWKQRLEKKSYTTSQMERMNFLKESQHGRMILRVDHQDGPWFFPESIAKGSSVRSPAEKIHRAKYIE